MDQYLRYYHDEQNSVPQYCPRGHCGALSCTKFDLHWSACGTGKPHISGRTLLFCIWFHAAQEMSFDIPEGVTSMCIWKPTWISCALEIWDIICSTSHFILFKRPPPRQPPSFDLSALLLFVPVLWDKNGPWATSLFQFLGFFVLCIYFVPNFEEVSSIVKYCTVIPYWLQKHIVTNNSSLGWCHGYQIVKQSVRNKRQKKKKRGKVLVPNYSKVEPFS